MKNSAVWIGVLVLAPLVLLGAGCAQEARVPEYEKGIDESAVSTSTATTISDRFDGLTVSAIVEPGVETTKTAAGKVVTAPTKNYSAALSTYGAAGARFQFINCSGTPGTLSIKKGNSFMLDNRDNKTHTLGIGVASYKLAPYDFAIIKLQNVGSFPITCDGGGSARVDVQA